MLAYIHIPFCDSKCFYCSFNSFTNMHDRKKSYIKALKKQILWDLEHFNIQKKSIQTLFIGGGTPSTILPNEYEEIFKIILPYIEDNAEITIEANPNSATFNWLKDIYNLGVNRVSFGVQSFNDEKLKSLNRAHSAKEAIKAVENANKVGFKNISIDIIYDFFLDTKNLLKQDLDIAFSLPINHISTYELTIEKATEFTKKPEVKKQNENFGYFIRDEIVKRGFSQYEVSNYGSYKSRHNLGYWKHKNYLGFGAGAVGYIDNFRYYPNSNLENYIKNPTKIKKEILSNQDILTEKIFLGLRSCVGIEQNILPINMQERAFILTQEKKLDYINGVFYNKEYFLSDELALFIMQI